MAFGKRAGVALAALLLTACQTLGLVRQYEYDERVELSLDGSAVVDISASIPALVALRGATLSVDPEARFDRREFAGLYAAPGVLVREVSAFRRHGRRFVHVRLDVSNIALLPQLAPLSWSRYRLDRLEHEFRFVQEVGPAARLDVGDVGWTGRRARGLPCSSSQSDQFPQLADWGRAWQHARLGTKPARSALGRASQDGGTHRNRVNSLPHPLAVRRNIHRGHAGAGRRRLVGQSKGRSVVPA